MCTPQTDKENTSYHRGGIGRRSGGHTQLVMSYSTMQGANPCRWNSKARLALLALKSWSLSIMEITHGFYPYDESSILSVTVGCK